MYARGHLFVVSKFAVAVTAQIIVVRAHRMDCYGFAQIVQRQLVRFKSK